MRELQGILTGGPIWLLDLDSAGISDEVEETGSSFAENAILKATAYREISGLATLADDSGLVVDALDGRPGVRSARYAGAHASDEENVARLLDEMRDVPTGSRTGRFECVVAIALPGREIVTFDGSVEGTIAETPQGDGGFGYDPVFLLTGDGQGSRTMAQLSASEKAALSHRGVAARKAAEWLRTIVAERTPEYN